MYNNNLSRQEHMDSKKMKLIATGSGSQIYHYQTKAGEFALKYVPNTSHKEIQHLSNEARVLQALQHDNIIKCLKYQEKLCLHGNKQNSQLRNFGNVMVLEYAPKGSLLKVINTNQLTLPQLKSLFKQLSQGLKFMHCKGYSHRDLKLQNILVFDQDQKLIPKLSDFGFATYCYKQGELEKFRNYRGTRKGYMAPQIHEVLTNKDQSYDAFKADIFSLGVIMFALVLGRLPFQYATKEDKIYKFIAQQDYESFWQQHQAKIQKTEFSEKQEDLAKFKDLFVRMVNLNPQERPSISEVLENSWLSL